jgi:two-component system phosphate regulon response regulator PhoB
MAHEHILVVEDEEEIQELIQYTLTKDGFRPLGVFSGEDALRKVHTETFACILLDIMLPGHNIPVIMLTAKGEEADIVTGLELGADDFIVKPFSPRVLTARIKSVLRRKSAEALTAAVPLTVHDIVIHPGRREVTYKNKPIELTNMEFQILYFLAEKPGWVFSRYQIVEGVRGDNYPVTDRAVDVMIVGLRKKLGEAGAYIETVRGAGYKFKE